MYGVITDGVLYGYMDLGFLLLGGVERLLWYKAPGNRLGPLLADWRLQFRNINIVRID
jgi:hypothetical protein